MIYLKSIVKKVLRIFNLELRTLVAIKFPPELSIQEIQAITYVKNNHLTMGSILKLIDTAMAVKYIIKNNISGDFVECGVWRGGHSILAKKIFELNGSDKKVWMFDTFTGMSKPNAVDAKISKPDKAIIKYNLTKNKNFTSWCYAPLNIVINNCIKANINLKQIYFIKGDVLKTLNKENLPESISFLRLDTDFYKSTKKELEILYPRIAKNGVITIDDYGSWQGSRKAVDEYFLKNKVNLFFNIVNYSQRTAIKL
jgi:O-methyltransferase